MRYFLYKQSFITKEEKEFISLPYNLNKSQFVAVLDNLSEEEDCTVTMKIYNQRDELVQSFDNLLVQKFNDLYTDIFEMGPNYKLRVKVDDTSSDEIEVHFSLLMIISKDKPVPPKIERPALTIITDSFETGVDNFWKRIQSEVRDGTAKEKYKIGDRFSVKWTDENNTTYDVPLDIVHYGEVELESGEKVPGMYLQWHLIFKDNMTFSKYQAFYYTTTGLPAGEYYILSKEYWGYTKPNKKYSFKLSKPIPPGGQLTLNPVNIFFVEEKNLRVYTYSSASSTNPIEIDLTLSNSSTGTYLGDFALQSACNEDMNVSGTNNKERVSYGYGRWSKSALRQYLNSSANIGEWWTPQTKFDRPPNELSYRRGFMAGYEQDFLDVLSPVRISTAVNDVESLSYDSDITYDTFFLPSLEEEYFVPIKSGIEGGAWDYWKTRKGLSSPQPHGSLWNGQTNEFYPGMRFRLPTKEYYNEVRLRSPNLENSGNAWYVDPWGKCHNEDPNYSYTCYAKRFAPVCVIC